MTPTLADLDALELRSAVAEHQRAVARAWPIGHPHNVECHRVADLLDPPVTIVDVLGCRP